MHASAAGASLANEPPLCVDLDGTLIVGDTLVHCVRLLLRKKPWTIFELLFAVRKGRARFKEHVARRIRLDPQQLRFRENVIQFLREQKRHGRRLVLATAAHVSIAESVAAHLGCFDVLIASDAGHNAKGDGKVAAIRERLGVGEFDYVGDSFADLPVWRAARKSFLVEPCEKLLIEARQCARVEFVFRA